ncbi:alpha/beta fold hydrolase [Actinomycetospora termitidis]|uniref:Alpha/beta fold hydrolase n=1 Tax=Actinomycetospora termitidis TaxID=3053470 RepID=A0ABT7MLS4_9PSEU|nr:alpha/beta fold hydrolase [Actinomycetospora sp. Odt1-22]MDL5160588.1 alpha/beta fold hydrolase [Actinomycetospora sp. Odt1-22]
MVIRLLVLPLVVLLGVLLAAPAQAVPAQDDGAGATRTQDLRIAVRDGPARDQPQSLDATLFLPARTPAPAVLLAHGFGADKRSVAGEARSLAARGYVVLAWSARGFGQSTGQIALNNPDYEVADAQQLVDWLAQRPEVTLDGPGDARVGVMGGSYGGALALLLAAYDRRVDVAVPMITWNDLGQALFPNAASPAPVTPVTPAVGANAADGVFKRSWASLFFGIGSRTTAAGQAPDVCGRFLPEICAGYVEAVRTGREPAALAAYLARSSPASVAGRIQAPTLLVQGENDTLFGLDQADANARAIAAGGGTVAVAWFNGGHDGGSPDGRTNARISGWLDHYLLGTTAGGAATTAPPTTFTYALPSGVRSRSAPTQRIVTAPSYPGLVAPGETPDPAPRTELALSGEAQSVVAPAGGVPGSVSSIPGLSGLAAGGSGGGSGDDSDDDDGGSGQGGGGQGGGGGGGASALLGRLATDLPGQAATFRTAPLAERTVVSGSPQVRVSVAATGSTAPGAPAPTSGPVLFGKVYDVTPGQNGSPETRTLLGNAVAPVRLPVLPPGGAATTVTVTLPAVVATVQAGHRLEVALATTDQGFASPADPAVYRVALASPALSVPDVPGSQTGGSTVPLGPIIAIGVLLVGVVVAVVVGRIVAARRRRRDLEPGGDLAVDPELVDVPLVVRGVAKRYRNGFMAVRDVSFRVERGQVLGLLGPNGAGKTTTLRMLMGLLRPTSGELRVFGVRVTPGAPVLGRIGSFVEGPGFLPHLSGRSNLELYWAATGRPLGEARMDEALEIAGLGTAVDRVVRTYSQGMRQRLAIAQAMLGLPDLLVLDEPTNGLDPPQIHAMREVLKDYAASGGRTVLVSSHLLAEVEQTCDHVVVMHRGEVVASGEVAELVAGGQVAVAVGGDAGDRDRAVVVLRDAGFAAESDPEREDVVIAESGSTEGERATVVRTLVEAGIAVVGVGPRRRLEDAFLALIGEDGR